MILRNSSLFQEIFTKTPNQCETCRVLTSLYKTCKDIYLFNKLSTEPDSRSKLIFLLVVPTK